MKAELQKIIDQTMITIHNLNDTKGMEYADEGDALANFKNRAAQLDLDPLKVWGIFFGKHADAIYTYVRNGKVYSEAIEGRIDDAILYLVLLKGLIQERSVSLGKGTPDVRGPLVAKSEGPIACNCGETTLGPLTESKDLNGMRHRRPSAPFPCVKISEKCQCGAIKLDGSEASREVGNWLHKRDRCLFLKEDVSA